MDRPRSHLHEQDAALQPQGLEDAARHARNKAAAARDREVAATCRMEAATRRAATTRLHRDEVAKQGEQRRVAVRGLARQLSIVQGFLERLRQSIGQEELATAEAAAKAAAARQSTGFTGLLRLIASAAGNHVRRWRQVAERSLSAIGAWKRNQAEAEAAASIERLARTRLTMADERSSTAWSETIRTNLVAGTAHRQLEGHEQAISGIRANGLVRYLARAIPAGRQAIQTVHQKAVAEGQAQAGRRPAATGDQEATARRARRAERARERRRRHITNQIAAEKNERRPQRREQRRQQREAERVAIDPAVDGSRPAFRQHDLRLAALPPDQQAAYIAHLERARSLGRAAAIREAHSIAALTQPIWKNQGTAIALGDGSRLIAVRGGDAVILATAMMNDELGLEKWLGEPALERNRLYGPRARLAYTAGHLVAAWSPALALLAAGGQLDEALAYEVDRVIARLSLERHRVVAFLHTDSESGHPHLHILYSRVRCDDHALWSLSGRERVPTLWLHARTTTVLARGEEALDDDIDALGGTTPASIAGEFLMWADKLSATRRHMDASTEIVPLQGLAAAHRIAHVGTFAGEHSLAGGLWKFGTGPDPKLESAWRSALATAQQSGDPTKEAKVIQQRPKNRGYCMEPDGAASQGYEWRHSQRFGWYLARRRAA